ncbi:DNA damage inducible protein [Phaffia rhodozyma]|uniref:DNA damage-inducible protein 1 n=1 Tax=Phaffia rhodozyma TaxID=264483 RepID=A0A0F7SZ11_PHARH|nr:DNA damage inducible protein [Phaffia rhodozyma]
MKITFTTAQNSFLLEVPADMTVGDLKAFVEVESSISSLDQRWKVNSGEVNALDTTTLDKLGWEEDTMVSLEKKSSSSALQQTPAGPSAGLTNTNALTPQQMEYFKKMMAAKQKEETLYRKLEANPWDVESQKRIEEIINQKAIEEAFDHAMEHQPEFFAQVDMLYIDVELNGTKIQAFVDSGAQMTVMSPECAERCGIMRMVDKRFSGEARGVGTAKILGRVHTAQMKFKHVYLPVSITVMEGKDVDLLLGLDMLRRHQAVIDLSGGHSMLKIQGVELPFLSEHELRGNASKWAREAEEKRGEPSSSSIVESKDMGQSERFPGSGSTISKPPSSIIPPTGPGVSGSGSGPGSTTVSAGKKADGEFPENSIEVLVGLGASRQEAIGLLRMCNGDIELAASSLF